MTKKRLFTKPVALLVTDNVHEKLMALCENREISISEWVREAIDLKLGQEKQAEVTQ